MWTTFFATFVSPSNRHKRHISRFPVMSSATRCDNSEGLDEGALNEFIQLHSGTVPYVGQSFSWDCGLACAQMALRAKGVNQATCYDLRKMCPTDSIWSIDIAYLLKQYRLNCVYYTVMKGVRPEYRKQEFYRRQLPEDTKRVNRLFENAGKDGVQVIQAHVPLCGIRRALTDGTLALVLMDKRALKCSFCDHSDGAGSATTSKATSFFPPGHQRGGSGGQTPGFLGHYVLLYAYYAPQDVFLIKDPAALRETCVISSDVLQTARMAFGTDQDILFIGNAADSVDADGVDAHDKDANDDGDGNVKQQRQVQDR